MPHLRLFRPGDEAALAAVCLRTADAGADATGLLEDDDLWAAVFVLPYLQRHPDLALVVETDDGRVAGYAVAVPDTRAFEDWFAAEWWPRFATRWPVPTGHTRQDGILTYAYARRGGAEPYGDAYPAHLHIDLLPELQGQGWGRRLIEATVDALRARGVSGLHLATAVQNTGAQAFYTRLGFAALPSHEGVRAYALSL